MMNFTSNSRNFPARTGLYRVWMPLRDDANTPLISIWIDARMTAFEPQHADESIPELEASEGLMTEEIEDLRSGIVPAATGAQAMTGLQRIS